MPKRNFRTKEAQFKGIKKTAAVYDDKERGQYLRGMIGAKQKRKKEYMKMKEEKQKQFIREQRAKIRNEQKEQIEKLQGLIDGNYQSMKTLSTADKSQTVQEKFQTKNQEVKVTTTFFK
ncbi:hypothetical protein pb186bvf_005955 [Paramecium bursaria]